MLVVALVLAVIGLAALVTAVVASNELVAWVCIGASALGVILLVIDSIRERKKRRIDALAQAEVGATAVLAPTASSLDAPTEVMLGDDAPTEVVGSLEEIGPEESELGEVELEEVQDYLPEEDDAVVEREMVEEDHPEEVVHDEPEYDTYSDDEPDFPGSAEEAAIHTETQSADEGESPVETEVVYASDATVDSETVDSETVDSETVEGATVDAAGAEEEKSGSTTRVVISDEES